MLFDLITTGVVAFAMDEKSLNEQIQARREALKWTQDDLASHVRRISGKPFTQQSLNKLEKPGANSRFMHFVLEALKQGESGALESTEEAAAPGLTATEATLIEAYRRLLESNEEQANLVMQVAFGAKPTQSTVNYPTTKELLDGWKDMLAEALSTDYQNYTEAANDSDKKIIEAKIGGRVIKMIEERERQLGAPGKVDRRTK